MPTTIRPRPRPSETSGSEPPKLPLRWAVILLAAGAVGFVGAQVAGPVAGITLAISAVGLLHQILL